jgi:SulP family sulfate permease
MAAMAVYPLFGSSRHVRVTMSSTMAVMSASIVAPLAASTGDVLTLTAALALTVGLLLVAAGVLRLGFLGDFLSKPIITGFLFGLGINIIVGQLPKIFGVPSSPGNSVQQFTGLLRQLPQTNIFTLAIGVGAGLLIIRLREIAPGFPGQMVAVVYGILLGSVISLESLGVATVGAIPTGLPAIGIPVVTPGTLAFLLAAAGSMVFLALGESLAAGRIFAARYRYPLHSDNELVGIGAANIASSLVGGVTVDASMSTTATSDAAGSRSQVSSFVTAGLTLLTVLFLAGLLKDLPNAVLGAVVISAVIGLLNRKEMERYWKTSPLDFVMGLAALLGVVLSDPGTGLILAVFLSLAIVLYRASQPNVVVLGRVRGKPDEFADLTRRAEAELIPGLLILRLDAGLFYANANEIDRTVKDKVEKWQSQVKGVLIDLGASGYIDLTSTDMLVELVRELNEHSIAVIFAHIRGPVRDQMRLAGITDEIGEANMVPTLAGGVERFGQLEANLEATASPDASPAS